MVDTANSDKFFPQTRVVGGGHTLFFYGGQPIALLDNANDSGQRPFGTPYEAILGVGDRRPREIVTQPVIGEGTLVLTLIEVWNAPVWYRLGAPNASSGLGVPNNGPMSVAAGSDDAPVLDIQQIFERQNEIRRDGEQSGITVMELIYPPAEIEPIRGLLYQNPIISAVNDGDQATVAGLSITKTVTVVYTHKQNPLGEKAENPFANFAR